MLIDCSAKLPADVTEAMFRTMEQQALGQVCIQFKIPTQVQLLLNDLNLLESCTVV